MSTHKCVLVKDVRIELASKQRKKRFIFFPLFYLLSLVRPPTLSIQYSRIKLRHVIAIAKSHIASEIVLNIDSITFSIVLIIHGTLFIAQTWTSMLMGARIRFKVIHV